MMYQYNTSCFCDDVAGNTFSVDTIFGFIEYLNSMLLLDFDVFIGDEANNSET